MRVRTVAPSAGWRAAQFVDNLSPTPEAASFFEALGSDHRHAEKDHLRFGVPYPAFAYRYLSSAAEPQAGHG